MKHKLNNIKNTGFKAPDGYFQNLEDTIMDRIKLDKALNSVDNTGFKIPNGYFDTLEDAVLTKIENEKTPNVISLLNRQTLIYISGVAAAILIMFNIFLNTTETSIDTIDAELVENYFIEQDVNTYELAMLLGTNDDTDLNVELFDESLNNDTLEDYLIENLDIENFIEDQKN